MSIYDTFRELFATKVKTAVETGLVSRSPETQQHYLTCLLRDFGIYYIPALDRWFIRANLSDDEGVISEASLLSVIRLYKWEVSRCHRPAGVRYLYDNLKEDLKHSVAHLVLPDRNIAIDLTEIDILADAINQ